MRRRRDEGLALFLAILVLAILILLITQMSITSLQNRTVAKNHLGDLQNAYAARSGYHLAVLTLAADLKKDPEADTLLEKWATPIDLPYGTSTVRIETKDSERFINLSQLVDDEGKVNEVVAGQLRRLVRILVHPPETAERIIDYIDADTKGEFEARARNERLFNVDEILRIEGLEPEVLYGTVEGGRERKGILPFLTVWPRPVTAAPTETGDGSERRAPAAAAAGTAPGQVNVNTAPVEVLWALSEEMTQIAAEAIVEYRSRQGDEGKPKAIKGLNEIQGLNGLTAEAYQSIQELLTVKSQTFEIHVRSKSGNVEQSRIYVVSRTGGESGGIKLLASLRKNEFLSVRPPEPGE